MFETIENALLNTILGMGTVFVVLIFISFIIFLLGFVPKLIGLFSRKKTKAEVAPQVAPVQSVVEPVQTASATDDLEIIAVITAAIQASMEDEGESVPRDGLVIRSIKRRGFAK